MPCNNFHVRNVKIPQNCCWIHIGSEESDDFCGCGCCCCCFSCRMFLLRIVTYKMLAATISTTDNKFIVNSTIVMILYNSTHSQCNSCEPRNRLGAYRHHRILRGREREREEIEKKIGKESRQQHYPNPQRQAGTNWSLSSFAVHRPRNSVNSLSFIFCQTFAKMLFELDFLSIAAFKIYRLRRRLEERTKKVVEVRHPSCHT